MKPPTWLRALLPPVPRGIGAGPGATKTCRLPENHNFFALTLFRFRPGHILQDSIYPIPIRRARGPARAHISRRQLTDADS
jgi:hypothetical protein